MKGYKFIISVAFVCLIFLISPTFGAQAKSTPYSYWFERAATTDYTFNNLGSLKKMVIEFDYPINAYPFTERPSIYSDIPGIIYGAESNGKRITVYFKNLASDSFLDYTHPDQDYHIIIPKGTLTSTTPAYPIESDYVIPFKIQDILPGFKTIFIDGDPKVINENIYKANGNREIFIHVPKLYMTKIETIHRYSGLDASSKLKPITNIDITADKDVERIFLTYGLGDDHQYTRDLERSTTQGYKEFTTGQAGLEAVVGNGGSNYDGTKQPRVNEINLAAYDKNGRYLESRSFKLMVKDKDKDYTVSDYIGKPAKEFGSKVTLYDLMNDKKVLQGIIEHIPVSQLDQLGVTYQNRTHSRRVNTYEQLLLALNNPDISSIELTGPIKAPDGVSPLLTINRNLTIMGNGNELKNVNLLLKGSGNINVALRNLKLSTDSKASLGNVTVDVGSNGTAILDKTDVVGDVKVLSGGPNTVYVHDSKMNTFTIIPNDVNQELRVVVSGKTEIADQDKGIDVAKGNHVILEVMSPQMLIAVDQGVTVDHLILHEAAADIRYLNDPNNPAPLGVIKRISGNGVGTIDGDFNGKMATTKPVSASADSWAIGKLLLIGEIEIVDGPVIQTGAANMTWDMESFDLGTEKVSWNRETNYLRIGAGARNGYVIFVGKNRDNQDFKIKVKVPIEIK